MDYHQIVAGLYVGIYPACCDDVIRLREDTAINTVLNVQTDEDIRCQEIDWPAIVACYQQHGIELHRVPIRDFDPVDLCEKLPECVYTLNDLLGSGQRVYLHCTAGVGRSPSIAVAYLHWCKDWSLEDAASFVKKQRYSVPNIMAIQEAGISKGIGDKS